MSGPDLPPDLDRLLAIEEHLRRQLDVNATVATYLGLELDRVRTAIERVQEPEAAAAVDIATWRDRAEPGRGE